MNKTLIYYHGGTYGTFIEWCLYYFTDPNFSEELPFTGTGSAHKHYDSHLPSHLGYTLVRDVPIQERIKQAKELKYQFVRTHQTVPSMDRFSLLLHVNEIKEYAQSFKNIIVIKFNNNNSQWIINNVSTKCTEGGRQTVKYWLGLFNNVNYQQWGKNRLEDMEPWQIRELLSIDDMRQTISLLDQNYEELADNVITVDLEKLWDNFETELCLLVSRLGYTVIRKDKIKTIETAWKKLQVHRFKDQLTDDFVDATINNISMIFDNMSQWDEAEIQYQLRERGYEIECDGLNTFPVNSCDLHKIIYKI